MREKFGTVLGEFDGVPAHSSDYSTSANGGPGVNNKSHDSVWSGYYCGMNWQCVEYARRYLLAVQGVTFANLWFAHQIFDQHHFEVPRLLSSKAPVEKIPIVRCANGAHFGDRESRAAALATHYLTLEDFNAYIDSHRVEPSKSGWAKMRRALCKGDPLTVPHLPRRGSLLMWRSKGFFFITGHVAVVTEVEVGPVDTATGVARGFVRVAEQNVHDRKWGMLSWSRELPLEVADNGAVKITDSYPGAVVLGWVTTLVQRGPIALTRTDVSDVAVESVNAESVKSVGRVSDTHVVHVLSSVEPKDSA